MIISVTAHWPRLLCGMWNLLEPGIEPVSPALQVVSQLNKYLIPQSKSESEVAQLCLTLCDPMYCSLPGFSIHGIFPGKSTGVGCLENSVDRRAWQATIHDVAKSQV